MPFRIAVIQMNTRDDKAANLAQAAALIDRAASLGAELVALPENFNYLAPYEGVAANAEPIPGPTTDLLVEKARQHGIYLHCGSIGETVPGGGRVRNTTLLLGPKGEILGRYSKLHLFDIAVGGHAPYNESEHVDAGAELVTAELPFATVGLTICYDIRFPELYRALALKGAQVIFTPAAFTLQTGKDHWEVLLRARAIENQVFVVAPAQVGAHPPNRCCFGNAMIVNPWGTVIARAPEEEAVVVADIDLDYLNRVRQQIPSLRHRREDVYGAPGEAAVRAAARFARQG